MAYDGYLEFNGIPLINAEATEAWVNHLAPTLSLTQLFRTDKLHIANQEDPYRTPVLDEAPWVNPLDPVTHGFFGLYPLSIDGLGDSTLAGTATEGIGNGGSVSDSRETTRSVRVSGLLVATSKLSAQAGLTWLRAALRTDGCEGGCMDGTLRYFLAEPDVCEIAFSDETGVDYQNFGDLAEGDSLRYRFQPGDVDVRQPARVWWTGSFPEGSSYTFGAMSRRDGTILQSFGPITPVRQNYLPNPTLRADSSEWVTTGNVVAKWQPTGGSDGDGYLAMSAPEGDPPVYPFGGGGFGAGAFGTVVTTIGYGQGAYGSGRYGSLVGATVHNAVRTGAASALPAGTVTASIALRSASAATVSITLFGSDGSTVATLSVPTGPTWQRVVLPAELAADDTLALELAGDGPFDADQAVLESGTSNGDYFDGNTIVEGYAASWVGQPDDSPSTLVYDTDLTTGYSWDDSDFRPFIQMVSGTASAVQLNWATRNALDVPTQLQPYERQHYDVGVTQGAQVVQELDLGSHGFFLQVDFVLVAGNPYAYSPPIAIDTTPLANAPFTDPTPATELDDAWLVDPDAIPITAPVAAPLILDTAIDTITSWERYYVPIPATDVADWASSVPTVSISTLGAPIKQVRVRFHPNPLDWEPDLVDPLSYCSEFVLSYLPSSALLTVDAARENASATKAGYATATANHLLYGSNGGPVVWPQLSCAIPYLMTVDVPTPADIDLIEVGLTLQRKE